MVLKQKHSLGIKKFWAWYKTSKTGYLRDTNRTPIEKPKANINILNWLFSAVYSNIIL